MYKWFNRFHSITVQLFLLFFIGMVVPVSIGGYVSYEKSARMIQDQVSTVASLTIRQLGDKLNMIFKKLDDTSMMLLGSEQIQKALQGSSLRNKDFPDLYEEASNQLIFAMVNSPEILDIFIFDHNRKNNIFSSSLQAFRNPWGSDWYRKIVEADGQPVWFGLSNSSYLQGTDMGIPVFGMGRAIKNWDTGKIIGVIFIEVKGNTLTNELRSVRFGHTGYTYLVDEHNVYMYHPDEHLYGKKSSLTKPEQMKPYLDEQRKLLMVPASLKNGWNVTGVVSVEELLADSKEIRDLTIWIAMAAVFLAIIMGYYVVHTIGRPLVHMSRLMKRGEEGDLSVRCENVGRNEIGQLGRSFNKMIDRIEDLIKRIGEEESQKKKAEIQALRYQINPHFLYNTLNSIRWMAKLNKTDDVVNAISTLVQLLEASLERNGPFVKLGDELHLLEKYLIIQQYRYDNKIALLIDCPPHLNDLNVPRMLLQPIVENAIFHGIAPKDESGTIEVNVREKGKDVHIAIADDGIGIDEQKIPKLLEDDDSKKTRGMTSIGLRHVHRTLQLYYGALYGVRVKNREGGGTIVEMVLPKQPEEEGNVKGSPGRR